METIGMNAVNKQDQARSIAQALSVHLKDLDALSAGIAAAHLDAALQALCRQFDLTIVPSELSIVEAG